MLLFNPFKCDKNLTWFICNLSRLDHIAFRKTLECASPPDLSETFLATMRKDVCLNSGAGSQQETESATWEEMSTTTADMVVPGLRVFNKHLYQDTVTRVNDIQTRYTDSTTYNTPDEYYSETPYANNTTAPEKTTEIIEDIILLAGNPTINLNDDNVHLLRIFTAVILPFLGVVVSAVVISLCCHCTGHACNNDVPNGRQAPPETVGDHTIEPYAVGYSQNDSVELQASTGSLPPETHAATVADQASKDNIIQPYAVTFTDVSVIYNQDLEASNGNLPPEIPATTVADQAPKANIIQPYAVTFADVSVIYNQDLVPDIEPSAEEYEEIPGIELQSGAGACD
ncbi:Hypp5930 [Branchiostoma lanceolatum]|uniref:Hypp5930 protein n=1 Tax=Branchiostoma lanceolatum TaxID=7740 RepID=A0A8J9VZT8_BRALA|nr:Hypp5930 [Branchiostoma lanceolatum]